MSDIQLFQEQSPNISYEALYRSTYAQVRKDFAHFCTPIDLQETPQPEEMLEAIVTMLYALQGDSLKMNSLFYRIDLSEKKKIPNGDIRSLALMILRREAQKVWIRANYSSPQE